MMSQTRSLALRTPTTTSSESRLPSSAPPSTTTTFKGVPFLAGILTNDGKGYTAYDCVLLYDPGPIFYIIGLMGYYRWRRQKRLWPVSTKFLGPPFLGVVRARLIRGLAPTIKACFCLRLTSSHKQTFTSVASEV